MKSSSRSAAPESAWMPMSAVPPSPAMASTVISLSRPVARSPAASPAAAAAVDGKATLTHGTSTEETGYMPPSTVRQLAGTAITMRPSSAAVICRRAIPMPHPAPARLPASAGEETGRSRIFDGMASSALPLQVDPVGRALAHAVVAVGQCAPRGVGEVVGGHVAPAEPAHRAPYDRRVRLAGERGAQVGADRALITVRERLVEDERPLAARELRAQSRGRERAI